MKHLFIILLVAVTIGAKGQTGTLSMYTTPAKVTMMQAVQIETSIDPKFKVIQKYITEAQQQVRAMMANEAIQGDVSNRETTKQLLSDLQAVMKLNRAKFMEAKETIIKVDSLQTITQKEQLTTEITRLKAEIIAGEDSTYIQPKINELTNKRNDLNKIIKNWVPIQ